MRNRRLFRLLAILFAFTLVAAACGDDDDSTSSSGESSASSSSSESSSAEGLNIGTLLPETGALAFLSAPLLEGVNMAIADINAAGGVNGADVTLTPGDSGTDPEIANTTVDRLLTEDVDAIVGAAASGITGSVIDKITSAGLPSVHHLTQPLVLELPVTTDSISVPHRPMTCRLQHSLT